MEIDKILSVAAIICAIPVTIAIVMLLARLFKIIFFHGSVNLEDVIFSKERIRQIDKSNMEQERNIVSIQEAVAVSNYKSQRELMMNILRKDTSQSLGSISYALNSEDTETSHYAATALRDELGDFRTNVLKLYKNVKNGEKEEPSQLCEFIEKTYEMICQDVFLPTEKKQYTGMIDEIMQIMLKDYKDDIKPQYYEWIVRCMIENDNKENARQWCILAKENLEGQLTPYKCFLRYYYYCDDGENFIKTIDDLKNTNIPIDSDTLEIFRMFG